MSEPIPSPTIAPIVAPIPASAVPESKTVVQTSTETTKTDKVDVGPKKGVQPVHVDGALYAGIGFLTALLASLNTEKAATMIDPHLLWWMIVVASSINGGLLALKMFRSTSYAESKQ